MVSRYSMWYLLDNHSRPHRRSVIRLSLVRFVTTPPERWGAPATGSSHDAEFNKASGRQVEERTEPLQWLILLTLFKANSRLSVLRDVTP